MTRKVWVGIHRYVGLTLLVLLLVNAVTGSVLAFQHELDRWLNPGLFTAPQQDAALPPDALIARVEAADPRLRVTLLPLDTPPATPSNCGSPSARNPPQARSARWISIVCSSTRPRGPCWDSASGAPSGWTGRISWGG